MRGQKYITRKMIFESVTVSITWA